jgi:hypothetical protein
LQAGRDLNLAREAPQLPRGGQVAAPQHLDRDIPLSGALHRPRDQALSTGRQHLDHVVSRQRLVERLQHGGLVG